MSSYFSYFDSNPMLLIPGISSYNEEIHCWLNPEKAYNYRYWIITDTEWITNSIEGKKVVQTINIFHFVPLSDGVTFISLPTKRDHPVADWL